MKLIALVGASGTGKSHRAIYVANEYKVDLIIDDGLLIRGSRIIAGISSKSQDTKIGAIRTALFSKNEHAQQVKNTINEIKPERILVLGTSDGMIKKIIERLELPEAEKVIYISEVATSDEIKRAFDNRLKHNKHVVPAPTMEVKPKLSGILSVPLQTIFSRREIKSYPSHLKVEQTVVKPTFNFFGKFYIANSALRDITKFSLYKFIEIDKLLKANFLSTHEGMKIKIELAVYFNTDLAKLGKEVQVELKDNIEHMTALHVAEIDVNFKKLVFA